MINIKNISTEKPYQIFLDYLKNANDKNQKPIDAISISSFNKETNEVESRFVNLKYIFKNEWIFFSNYNSLKAHSFETHHQISALIYWESIDVQIRLKAKIKKTTSKFSDQHFNNRKKEKNALAISSNQSQIISSYKEVKDKYNEAIKNYDDSKGRPSYWGGYSFTPYYFEFWEGNINRLNKRIAFKIKNGNWFKFILEP